ncbi:hypothetical protein SAMN02745121_04580 [Nannocystis exedens]|uniref:Uncharacterized protein n=1 Tax=Nannocystis exedens TaxID=54 RepID=A0A1I2BE11_9BACT|nr:hypothetical protein [Nannocystis exedens]PCC68077.1 hypothetical protein NAEX_01085 [Nannocystis exedens]SFE53390.1 hypothetical protein SAMN02745121_04580 [Nannocystis exedens]
MLAVLMAATIVAAAEPPPGLALDWTAPPGCPDEAEVYARVIRRTGQEAADRASLTARATVREAAPGRWALTLELTGATGGGRRELSAPRCDELVEAAALVVAIAVDPRAALAGGAGVVPAPPPDVAPGAGAGEQGANDMSQGAGPSEQMVKDMSEGPRAGPDAPDEMEAPVADPPPPPAARPAPAEKPRRVQLGLRAAAGVSFARLLPRPSAAVSLALSLSGKRWRAELGGLYAPPVTGGTAAIGGLFQAGAVELRGCPVLRRGAVEVPLCVGLQFGAMEGRGRGTDLVTTTTARSPWLAATVGAAVAWRPRGRVGLWLGADAIAALLRPSFVTAGGVKVHEAARFGGQVLVGVEVQLR